MLSTRPFDDLEVAPPAFVDADEIPDALLDEAPAIDEEGDDSVHQHAGGRFLLSAISLPAPLPPKARARVVPFRRPVKRGTTGPDVIAVKRALSHAGYLKWPKKWDRRFGTAAMAALVRFQKQTGLKADGVYGTSTHRKLVGLGHFDKYGAYLMALAPRATADKSKRQAKLDKIEAFLWWQYHHRAEIHYLQRRPMHTRDFFGLPQWEDCSELATKCFRLVDAPDPNGEHYNGAGWTGTLVLHGVPGPWQMGALNFYGHGWPYKHVTIGVSVTRQIGMGSEIGPLLLPVAYRPDYAQTRVYPLS